MKIRKEFSFCFPSRIVHKRIILLPRAHFSSTKWKTETDRKKNNDENIQRNQTTSAIQPYTHSVFVGFAFDECSFTLQSETIKMKKKRNGKK